MNAPVTEEAVGVLDVVEASFDKLANLPFLENRPTKETAQALREELQNAYPPPNRPYDPERNWCKRIAADLAEAYTRDVLPSEIAGGRR